MSFYFTSFREMQSEFRSVCFVCSLSAFADYVVCSIVNRAAGYMWSNAR